MIRRCNLNRAVASARLYRRIAIPTIRVMQTPPDNPAHGFQFPGAFEITAMGPAGSGLEEQIPALLAAAGLLVLHETVVTRESSGGKYVSVKLSFRAESREQYDVAHAVLREHPQVKWTL